WPPTVRTTRDGGRKLAGVPRHRKRPGLRGRDPRPLPQLTPRLTPGTGSRATPRRGATGGRDPGRESLAGRSRRAQPERVADIAGQPQGNGRASLPALARHAGGPASYLGNNHSRLWHPLRLSSAVL